MFPTIVWCVSFWYQLHNKITMVTLGTIATVATLSIIAMTTQTTTVALAIMVTLVTLGCSIGASAHFHSVSRDEARSGERSRITIGGDLIPHEKWKCGMMEETRTKQKTRNNSR